MAKKGNNKGKARTRRQNNIRNRAQNDVQLMNQAPIDVLNAQLQQAQEDYLRSMQTGQSVYGGAADAIKGIESPDFGSIANQLSGWLGNLAPQFQGGAGQSYDAPSQQYGGQPTPSVVGMPENEIGAANALGGAIGAAGMSGLANDASRFGMSQAGAQREAVVGGRNVQDSLMQRMDDALQGYNDQLHGIMAQQPYQIKSRIDELSDQALEEQLARQKMKSDQAFSDFLAGQIGGSIGGGPGGGGPGGGGGGGGGGNPVRPPRDVRGNYPANGGYGDTAAGGNSFGGGMTRAQRIGGINAMDDYGDLPAWIKRLRYTYPNGGPASWQGAQELAPRKRQIWRQTRDHVYDLAHEEYPWVYGGGQ